MPTTYRLSPVWRVYSVFIFVMGVGFAAVFVWLAVGVFQSQPGSQALMYVFAIIMALLGIGLSLAALRSRLVLSPAGLEFHSIGYHVRAAWSQVAGLDTDPSCSGLAVSAPTLTLDGWFAILLRLSSPLGLATLLLRGYNRIPNPDQLGRCIPVRAFVTRWDNSDLARDLARYLPAATWPPLGG
jgi:hypothetical protein